MPLVAPTKTATRPGGRVEAMRELKAWTVDRRTMITDQRKESFLKKVSCLLVRAGGRFIYDQRVLNHI